MNTSSQSGLSLLGVLVALLVLIVGITSIAQLNAQNKHYVSVNRTRLLAISLANEGLELTQAYRDTVWLEDPEGDWAGELCDSDGSIAIDADTDSSGVMISTSDFTLYQDSAGLFSHVPSDNPSQFQRRLTVDCDYEDTAFTSEDPDSNPHITVTSTVSWGDDIDNQNEVSLSTILYDWH